MSSQRGKTTPASTPGSYSPHAGRPNRTQPDIDGGAEPFTDGHQLIDLQARLHIGRIITAHRRDITGFTLRRNEEGTVDTVEVNIDGTAVPTPSEVSEAVIRYCSKHPDTTSTVNNDHIPMSQDSATRYGLSGVPHSDDPRFGFVADHVGTPRLAILDENLAQWALDHTIGRRFQSFACDQQVAIIPTWSPDAVTDCYEHPVSADQWAATPEGTIIRHPTSLWTINERDPADGDVEFRGYNPDTGELSYSELGKSAVNTVEPDFARLFRAYPTGTPE